MSKSNLCEGKILYIVFLYMQNGQIMKLIFLYSIEEWRFFSAEEHVCVLQFFNGRPSLAPVPTTNLCSTFNQY